MNKVYGRTRRKFRAIDSTQVKNIFGQDRIGRNPTDRGRNGTKLSITVNNEGIPLAFTAYPSNTSDYNTFEDTIKSMYIKDKRKNMDFLADKGYDSVEKRDYLTSNGYNQKICRRGEMNAVNNKLIEKERWIVENFFSWMDQYRRLIVRYDQYITSYMSHHMLAMCIFIGNRLAKLNI